MFNNKTIFLTGGTGSFGQAFARHVLSKYKLKKLIIFSRDELKQFNMQQDSFFFKNKNKIRYFLGDIRDLYRLDFAMNNVDIVVHAAALKQVDTGEYNPFEFIKTNIIGAQNIIETSLKKNVSKVIALSTDKASSPINLYGATKLCSDKLFVSANNYSGTKKTIFSVVRYGNVMGSRGSVIKKFIDLRSTKKPILITDTRMTRFNITLKQSIDFVDSCFKNMQGGEIFVPKIKSYKILNLKNAIAPKHIVKIIGTRQGEKLHESLISNSEAANTVEYKNYFSILDNFILKNKKIKKYFKNLKNRKCKKLNEEFSYVSNKNKFLTTEELKILIQKNLIN